MATRRPKVPQAHYGAAPAVEEAKTTVEVAPEDAPAKEQHSATKAPSAEQRAVRRKPVSQGTSSRIGSDLYTGVSFRPADDSAETAPVPARSFSGRLLVLGLVMAVITLLLAPNVHTFMEQRAEIAELKQDIANKQAQKVKSEAELARWDDPAYVKQQARDRVSMLMPGETGYWVYGTNGTDTENVKTSSGTSALKATTVTTQPWADGLWEAIQKSAEVDAKPAPAAKQVPTKTDLPPQGAQ